MSRTQKSYTIVSIDEERLATSHYANVDALKEAIAKNFAIGHHEFLVFEGNSIEIAIDVAPRVTLGKKERKPRGPNKKKNGAKVGADFFEKKPTTETIKAKE